MKNIEIRTAFQKFIFSPECGGFPSHLSVTESDGNSLTLWDVKAPFLSLKTADGTTLRPVLQGKYAVRKFREGSAKILYKQQKAKKLVITQQEDGSLIVVLPLSSETEAVRWILDEGGNVEVLSPRWGREKICTLAKKTAKVNRD